MNKILHCFALILIIISSFGLFELKFHSQDLNRELREIKRQINEEEENLLILKAEWSHLNNTERLQYLSDKYLNLDQISISQIPTTDLLTKLEDTQTQDYKEENIKLVRFEKNDNSAIQIREASFLSKK